MKGVTFYLESGENHGIALKEGKDIEIVEKLETSETFYLSESPEGAKLYVKTNKVVAYIVGDVEKSKEV